LFQSQIQNLAPRKIKCSQNQYDDWKFEMDAENSQSDCRMERLIDALNGIDSFYDEFGEKINQISKQKEFDQSTIQCTLEFASLLRFTIHAPPGYQDGFPIINGFPPAPQPIQMRSGKLAAYNEQAQQKLAFAGNDKNSNNIVKSEAIQLRMQSLKEKLITYQEQKRQQMAMEIDRNEQGKDTTNLQQEEIAPRRATTLTFNMNFEDDEDDL
jgi:hypothetical protein